MTFADIIRSIDSKEKKILAIVIVFLLIITVLPYVYGAIKTPPGYTFIGRHAYTMGDTPLYFSYIEQARQGNILFKNLYSSEPQSRVMFLWFFLPWGWIAQIFNLSNFIALQSARIVMTLILLGSLYLLISYIFQDKTARKISLLFTAFASGLGLYFSPFIHPYVNGGYYHWPMDLWVSESNIFFTILNNPLHAASLAGIVLVFLFMLLAYDNKTAKYSIIAGIIALLTFLFHPYHLPTISAVMGLFFLIITIKNKKIDFNYLKQLTILALFCLPAVIYYSWLLKFDANFSAKAAGSSGYTTSLILTMISYGGLFIFGLIGLIISLTNRSKNPEEQKNNFKIIFLATWLAAGFILIYCRFLKHPRRLTEGLEIPLIFFTVIALMFLTNYFKKILSEKIYRRTLGNKMLLLIFFAIFFCSSNFYLILNDINVYREVKNNRDFYLPNDKYNAIIWLKNNLNDNDVILSDPYTQNLIPGISGRTVYAGHFAETVDASDKVGRIFWFFANNKNEDEEINFLKNNRIDYLFYSNDERAKGDYNPRVKTYWQPVYQNDEVEIYKFLNINNKVRY